MNNIFEALRAEIQKIQDNQELVELEVLELEEILFRAILESLEEIEQGANSDEFKSRTIVNFLLEVSDTDYSTEAVKKIISDIRNK